VGHRGPIRRWGPRRTHRHRHYSTFQYQTSWLGRNRRPKRSTHHRSTLHPSFRHPSFRHPNRRCCPWDRHRPMRARNPAARRPSRRSRRWPPQSKARPERRRSRRGNRILREKPCRMMPQERPPITADDAWKRPPLAPSGQYLVSIQDCRADRDRVEQLRSRGSCALLNSR
jgi:hypothetical protein